MVFMNTFFILIGLYNIVISSNIKIDLFQIPNTKYISINESVTVSCKTNQNTQSSSVLFKRHDLVMSMGCMIMTDEQKLEMKCDKDGDWYYMNATIPKVTWKSRGRYQCTAGEVVKDLELLVHAPSNITMKVDNVTYNWSPDDQYFKEKKEKLKGTGKANDPFKVSSRKIKNVSINCSSSWSFPEVKYKWSVTRINTDGKIVETVEYKERNFIKNISKEISTEEMYKTSSLFELDCTDLKISGLVMVECSNVNQYNEDSKSPQSYYFLCPDFDANAKANSSRVTLTKNASKLTTGEMINIVIGCTIGVILMVVGIILICRHHPKDDIDRYTMRQNSVEHPGYRV